MPKENRRGASRKSKRQCLEADDDSPTPPKTSSVMGTTRYSPFQRLTPRRETRSGEEMLTLTKASQPMPKNVGIIESGFKYLMFLSLHLLQLCTQFGIGPKSNADENVRKLPEKDDLVIEKTTRVKDLKKSEISGVCGNCQKNLTLTSSASRRYDESSRNSTNEWEDSESVRLRRRDTSKSDENSASRRDTNDITHSSKKLCESGSKDNRGNGKEDSVKSSDHRTSRWESNSTSRRDEDRSTKNKEDYTTKLTKVSSSELDERVESGSKGDGAVSKEGHGSSSNRYDSPKTKEQSGHSEDNRKEHSLKMEKDRPSKSRNDKRTEAKDRNSMVSRRSPKKNEDYDSDGSSDEMVTAAEDSDSSNDCWRSANSTMLMNVSVDPGSYMNEISMLEYSGIEPMDISMEEPIFGRTYAILKSPRDLYLQQNSKLNDANTFSETPVSQASSSSSIDEEIARIFQKQCTSSDDEYSSSPTEGSVGRLNNLCSRDLDERRVPGRVGSKKTSGDKESVERKKLADVDEVRKIQPVVEAEEAKEKKCDGSSKTKQKYESSQSYPVNTISTPSKHKSRTPVKNKDAKRKELKYRERATQTDSAFSDEDVEMTPIDARSSDKRTCCRSSGHKSRSIIHQIEETDRDLNYVADNEDSNDGSVQLARSRVSSESASSSSTSDLGFEERTRATPDVGHRIGDWQGFPPEVRPFHGVHVTRAPPGFPQIPQNPPASFCNCGRPNCFILAAAVANDVKHRSALMRFGQNYAPAPTPMRHLYHEYPEFMISSDDINASKIFRNIFEKDRL